MTFTITRLGSVVFFRLAGTLGAGTDLTDLHKAVSRMSDATVRGVFLDLARVARLDCTGIGEIVRLCAVVGAGGRAFGLVNVDAKQQRMLAMIQLTPLFTGPATIPDVVSNVPSATRRFYATRDRFAANSGTELALV